MPDRDRQLRRDRDRKPWDTWRQDLGRAQSQDPSTGRNSVRMEQWRGGTNKNEGRRGKRKRKEDQKVNKQRRANANERREELARRPGLMKRAKAKIARICDRCEQGIATAWAETPPYRPVSPFTFTSEGRVTKALPVFLRTEYGHVMRVVLVVERIQRWDEMSTKFLAKIIRSPWRPFEPKTVLDLLVEAVSG